jgi:hypothetical protein
VSTDDHPKVQGPDSQNNATFTCFHDAVNRGDAELISKTINEVFDSDLRLGTPLPVDAPGAQALKHVRAILLPAYPEQIAETWGVVDVLSQMKDLGVNQA